jgi:recombinational DNA repair protein RecR
VKHFKKESDASQYLSSLNGAAPDLTTLRDCGVSQAEAVAICSEHHRQLRTLEWIVRRAAEIEAMPIRGEGHRKTLRGELDAIEAKLGELETKNPGIGDRPYQARMTP